MDDTPKPIPDEPEVILPPGVTDGGPWKGPSEQEWVERIASPATPVREVLPWIKNHETHISKGK